MRFLLAILFFVVSLFAQEVFYGSDTKQSFDIYYPDNNSSEEVVFMVHGGAWKYGDKTSKRVVDNKLKLGKILVSVNYRLSVDPKTQVEDIYAAFLKAKSILGNKKYIIMGHSAGAHLATVMFLSKNDVWSGLVSLDTSYDMTNKRGFLYSVFNGKTKEYLREVSPIYILKEHKPILLVCSKRRNEETLKFAEEAKKYGKTEVLQVNKSHAEINEDVGSDTEYTATILSFMDKL